MNELKWPEILATTVAGKDLTYEQANSVMDQVMTGEAGDARLAGFLTALAAKGATVEEIRGLADSMQSHAVALDVPTNVLDIVGTGGDQAHTVNISTMASLVIAAAGVPLVKHGNRASTSSCGAADVIEALGVNLNLNPKQVAEVFKKIGITFCFANLFHPSMRFAAPVRKMLGIPTAFNVLGPLTNPAAPEACAVGVASEKNAPLVAGVFAARGMRGLVFRGINRGLDELSAIEPTQIWDIRDGKVEYSEVDATTQLGLQQASLEDLRGGDPAHNAKVFHQIMNGQEGPIQDAVLLNAAGGIVAYGLNEQVSQGDLVDRLKAGLQIARQTLESGKPAELLEKWIELTK